MLQLNWIAHSCVFLSVPLVGDVNQSVPQHVFLYMFFRSSDPCSFLLAIWAPKLLQHSTFSHMRFPHVSFSLIISFFLYLQSKLKLCYLSVPLSVCSVLTEDFFIYAICLFRANRSGLIVLSFCSIICLCRANRRFFHLCYLSVPC